MTLRPPLLLAALLAAVPAAAELPIVTPAAGVSVRAQEGRPASPCAEIALHLGGREGLTSRWGPSAFGSADLRLGLTVGSRSAGSLDAGVGLSWGFGEAGRNANMLRLSVRPSLVVRTDGVGIASEIGIGAVSGVFPVIVRYDRYWRWGGADEQLVSVLVGFDMGLLAGLSMSS